MIPGSQAADLRVRNNIAPRNASMSTSANGTDVVNIANPKDGISHNNYSSFDVNSAVILNNSKSNGVSQTGGFVTKNPNLTQNARLIITEVNGPNPSNINGSVEVFGKSADLIFANENGIVVNGASFINANGITLTTGQIEANNIAIRGSGQIKILEKGIGVSGNYFNIIARGMSLAGNIVPLNPDKRPNINLIAGLNTVSTKDLANPQIIESKNTNQDKPLYGIDGSALGSMYADRIKFISTEDGVGVRHKGSIKSLHDLEVLAQGSLELNNAVSEKGNVNLESKGDAKLNLVASEASKVTLKTKNLESNLVYANDGLDITSKDTTIKKAIVVSKDLNLNSNQTSIDDTLVASGSLKATTKGFKADKVAVSGGSVDINSSKDLDLDSIKADSGSITLAGIKVDAKDIASSQDVNIKADSLLNSSLYSQGGAIKVDATTASLDKVQALKDVSLKTTESLKATSILSQDAGISLQAKNLNLGDLESKNALTLNATSDITANSLLSKDSINITSNNLSSNLIEANNNIDITSKANINTTNILSTEGAISLSGNILTNKDLIQAAQNINLTSTKDTTLNNVLSQEGSLNLNSQASLSLANAQAKNALTFNAIKDITANSLLSKDSINITSNNLSSNLIEANNNIDITSKANINTTNILSTEGAINLKAKGLLANTNALQAKNDISLSSEDRIDTNTILSTTGSVLLSADKDLNNKDIIQASKDITLDSNSNLGLNNILSQTGDIKLASSKDTTLANAQAKNALILNAEGNINAKSLLSKQDSINIESNDLNSDLIKAFNDINLKANNVETNNLLSTKGNIKATTKGSLSNKDLIEASKNITLNLTGDAKLNNILSDTEDINLDASNLTLANAQAKNALTLNAKRDLNSQSLLSKEGAINIKANKLDNTNFIEASKDINLNATSDISTNNLLSTKGAITITGQGSLKGENFQASKDITLNSQDDLLANSILSKEGSITLNSQQNLDLKTLQASLAASLNAKGSITSQDILSKNLLSINASSLTNSNLLSSQDDLTINTTNSLEANSLLSTKGSIALSAGGKLSTKDIQASKDITLSSTKDINANNLLSQEGSLNIKASNLKLASTKAAKDTTLNTQDINASDISSDFITINANSLNTNYLQASKDINLKASTLNTDTIVSKAGNVSISTDNNLKLNALQAAQSIKVDAASLQTKYISGKSVSLNAKGDITNSGLIKGDTLSLNSKNFSNEASFDPATALKLGLKDTTSPISAYLSGEAISITAANALNNLGNIDATTLNLSAASLQNQGSMFAKDNLDATYTSLTNTGNLSAQTTLSLQGGDASNAGKILSSRTLNVQASSLSQDGTLQADTITIKSSGNITNTKDILASSKLELQGNDINNSGQILATTLGIKANSINNTKTINATNALLTSNTYINNTGTIKSKNLANLIANNLTNKGSILANDIDLTLKGASASFDILGNYYGSIVAQDALNISTTSKDTQVVLNDKLGKLYAGNKLAFNAKGNVLITSDYQNAGSIDINTTGDLQNQNSLLASGKSINLSAQNITNSGYLWSGDNLNIKALTSLTNTGNLESLKDMSLSSASLINKNQIYAHNNLSIESKKLQNISDLNGKIVISPVNTSITGIGYANYGDTLGKTWDSGVILQLPNYSYETNIKQSVIKSDGNLNINTTSQDKSATIDNILSLIIAKGNLTSVGNLNNETPVTKLNIDTILSTARSDGGFDLSEHLGSLKTNSAHYFRNGENLLNILKYFATANIKDHQKESSWNALKNAAAQNADLDKYFSLLLGPNYAKDRFIPKPETWNNDANLVFTSNQSAKVQGNSDVTLIGNNITNQTDIASKNSNIATAISSAKPIDLTSDISKDPLSLAKDSKIFSINKNLSASSTKDPKILDTNSTSIKDLSTTNTLVSNSQNPQENLVQTISLKPLATNVSIKDSKTTLDTNSNLSKPSLSEDKNTSLQDATSIIAAALKTSRFNQKVTYYVETNLDYIDMSKFYGSQYFFNQIGFDSKKPITVIGDAYYEHALLSASLNAQLKNNMDLSEGEIKSLIDNGVSSSKELGLKVGSPLTQTQVDNLKQNLIWYVYTKIDGKDILTPKLYLTKQTLADNSNLPSNLSSIVANKSLRVESNGIDNYYGNLKAKDEIALNTDSFNNISSNLEANSINITAKKALISTKLGIDDSGNLNSLMKSKLSATKAINIITDKDLDITNSDIKALSPNSSVLLASKNGNINIKNANSIESNFEQKDINGTKITTSTLTNNILSSNISGGNLAVLAKDSINLKGSNLIGTNKDGALSLEADKIAISDAKKKVDEFTNSYFAGINQSTHMLEVNHVATTNTKTSTSQGSNVAGLGDVVLKAKNSLDIKGSDVEAKNTLALASKKVDIRDSSSTLTQNATNENAQILGYSKVATKLDEDLSSASNLKANNLAINASKDINITGSNLEGKQTNLEAKDINFKAGVNKSKKTTTSDSFGLVGEVAAGLAGNSASASFNTATNANTASTNTFNPNPNTSNINGTMNSDALASASIGLEFANQKTSAQETKHTLSNIKGDNVNINAKDRADIGGVNIESKNNLAINAGKLDSTKAVDLSKTSTEGFSIYAKQSFNTTSNLASLTNQIASDANNVSSGKNLNAGIVAGQVASNAANMILGDLASQDSIQSLGFTYNKAQSSSKKEVGGLLKAGNNLSLSANKGDLNLNGINLEANNIALKAKDNININALKSQNTNLGYSFGAEARLSETAGYNALEGGHTNVGVGGSINGSYNKEDSTNYTNAKLDAKNTLSLESGKDTNLQGVNATAKNINLNIGKDLNVSSLLDKTNSTGFSLNAGGDVSVGLSTNTIVIGAASGNLGFGYNTKDSSLVGKQSGLFASEGISGKVSNDIALSGATLSAKNGNLKLGGNLKHKDLDIYNHSDGALVNISGGTAGSGNEHNFGADININDHVAIDGKVLSAANIKLNGKDADINHDVTDTTTLKDSSWAGGSMNASLSTDMLKGLKNHFSNKKPNSNLATPNSTDKTDSIALASVLANNLVAKADSYKEISPKNESLLFAPKKPKDLESKKEISTKIDTLATSSKANLNEISQDQAGLIQASLTKGGIKKTNPFKSAFKKLKAKVTKHSYDTTNNNLDTTKESYTTTDTASINYVPAPLERKPITQPETKITQGDIEDVMDSIQHISDNLGDLTKLSDANTLLQAVTSTPTYKKAFKEDYLQTGVAIGSLYDRLTPKLFTSREDLKGIKKYNEFSDKFFNDATNNLVNNKDYAKYAKSDLSDNKNVEALGNAIICSYADTCKQHNIAFYQPKIEVGGSSNQYVPHLNKIFIKDAHIRDAKALTGTIFHETTHARQDNMKLHTNMQKYDKDTKDFVSILNVNQNNYADPKEVGYSLYANQPIEAEAFIEEAKLSRLLDTKYQDLFKQPHTLAQDMADRLTLKADTYKEATKQDLTNLQSPSLDTTKPDIDRTLKPVVDVSNPPRLPSKDSLDTSKKLPSQGDKKDIDDLLKRANAGVENIKDISDVSDLLQGIANNKIYQNLRANEGQTKKEFGKVVANVGKNLEKYNGYEGYKNFTDDITKEVTDKILNNPNFESYLKADLSSKDNKRGLVKVIESEYSKVLQDKGLSGIKAQVVIRDDMKQLGAYSSSGETNVLAITNKADVHPIRLANVALHELTHGRQDVFNKDKDKLPTNVLAAHSIYALNSDNNNYFSSNYGREIYTNQPVEKESFTTGDNFERILKDKYPNLSKGLKDDLATSPQKQSALQKLSKVFNTKKVDDKNLAKFYDERGLKEDSPLESTSTNSPLVETLHLHYSEEPQALNFAPNDPKSSKDSKKESAKRSLEEKYANPLKANIDEVDNQEMNYYTNKKLGGMDVSTFSQDDLLYGLKNFRDEKKARESEGKNLGKSDFAVVSKLSTLLNHSDDYRNLERLVDKSFVKSIRENPKLKDDISSILAMEKEGKRDLSKETDVLNTIASLRQEHFKTLTGINPNPTKVIQEIMDEGHYGVYKPAKDSKKLLEEYGELDSSSNKIDAHSDVIALNALPQESEFIKTGSPFLDKVSVLYHELTHQEQTKLIDNKDIAKNLNINKDRKMFKNAKDLYNFKEEYFYPTNLMENDAYGRENYISNKLKKEFLGTNNEATKLDLASGVSNDLQETLHLHYSEEPQALNFAPNDPKSSQDSKKEDFKPSVDRTLKPVVDISNPPSLPPKNIKQDSKELQSNSDKADIKDLFSRVEGAIKSKDLNVEQIGDIMTGIVNTKSGEIQIDDENLINHAVKQVYLNLWKDKSKNAKDYEALTNDIHYGAYKNYLASKDNLANLNKDLSKYANAKAVVNDVAQAYTKSIRDHGIKDSKVPSITNDGDEDFAFLKKDDDEYINMPDDFHTRYALENKLHGEKKTILDSAFHEMTHKLQHDLGENQDKFNGEARGWINVLYSNLSMYTYDDRLYKRQPVEDEAYKVGGKLSTMVMDALKNPSASSSKDATRDTKLKETLVLKYSEEPQKPNFAPNDLKNPQDSKKEDFKPSVDRSTKPSVQNLAPSLPLKAALPNTYKTTSIGDALDTLNFIKQVGKGFDTLSLEEKSNLIEGGLLNSKASLNSKKSLLGDVIKLEANKHIFTPFGTMLATNDPQVSEYKSLLHNVSADAVENLALSPNIDALSEKDYRLLDNYKPLLGEMAGAFSDAMNANGIKTTTPNVKNSISADTISFNHKTNELTVPKTYTSEFTFEPNAQKAKDNALESGFHELIHKFQAGVIENIDSLSPNVANVGKILKANAEYYFDGGHEAGDRDENIKRYESQALEKEAYTNASKVLDYYKDVMDTNLGVASMDDLRGNTLSDGSSSSESESEDEGPLKQTLHISYSEEPQKPNFAPNDPKTTNNLSVNNSKMLKEMVLIKQWLRPLNPPSIDRSTKPSLTNLPSLKPRVPFNNIRNGKFSDSDKQDIRDWLGGVKEGFTKGEINLDQVGDMLFSGVNNSYSTLYQRNDNNFAKEMVGLIHKDLGTSRETSIPNHTKTIRDIQDKAFNSYTSNSTYMANLNKDLMNVDNFKQVMSDISIAYTDAIKTSGIKGMENSQYPEVGNTGHAMMAFYGAQTKPTSFKFTKGILNVPNNNFIQGYRFTTSNMSEKAVDIGFHEMTHKLQNDIVANKNNLSGDSKAWADVLQSNFYLYFADPAKFAQDRVLYKTQPLEAEAYEAGERLSAKIGNFVNLSVNHSAFQSELIKQKGNLKPLPSNLSILEDFNYESPYLKELESYKKPFKNVALSTKTPSFITAKSHISSNDSFKSALSKQSSFSLSTTSSDDKSFSLDEDSSK
ncbi:hypothetical protein BKH43_04110 [Helicobacter sp. 13S00401-1]|uniref:two-partner secretion domain-containing protein n=1 Tax=Helicobacter sp. 13S00401-1 TaxID=1905758 RepID=UPI000BA62972|nr:hemagglutinin repeat-containing protein [Helicobacter sp. 13S00401-1]PAF50748.1 hypothetical protein BKH43_04110 [Helicobacter sp. 13S00401-1]